MISHPRSSTSMDDHSRLYESLEVLLIVTAAVLAFLLIPRGAGCDGDFPRNVEAGAAYLLKGFVPGGRPPFPVMAVFHGLLPILAGFPGPWWHPIINVFSFICGGLSLLFFYLIIREYQQEELDISRTTALAFMAVHPIFVVASGTWSDYGFSLVLVLGAWLCLL